MRQTTARYMVESALFVIVASAAIGGLASFFALRNNPLQGAFTNAVLTGAGKVLLSVLISLLAARLVIGTSTVGWASAFFDSVEKSDLRFALWKSVISGFLVAVVTYHLATGPKRSGRNVGEAVNASIVLGMVVVLAVHSLFTLWQFS